MRFVRLVGAFGIVLAFLFMSLAGGYDRPAFAAPSADGPIALIDTYVTDSAVYVASGAQVLKDYRNGYLLIRLPAGMRAAVANVPGLDLMAGRTNIDIYFSGVRFDTASGEPAFPASLRANSGGAYLLQFIGPVDSVWLSDLHAAGLTFEQYLASFAFIVTGSPAAIAAAKAYPFVGWVGAYHPGYKVSPALLDREGTVEVSIVGFGSVSPLTLMARVLGLGGRVELAYNEPSTVVAALPAAMLSTVAGLPDVMYVQPYSQPVPMDRVAGQIHHYQDAWTTRTSGLTTTLTGRSPGPDGIMYTADDYFEGAGIMDTGFDEGNANEGANDFFASPTGDRVTRFRNQPPGQSGLDGQVGGTAHGSHVAGIIASDGYSWERYLIENVGDPSVSTTDKDWARSEAGVAPEAKISVDGVTQGGGLAANPIYWDCEYLNGYITITITTVTQTTCGLPWFDGLNVATHNANIDGATGSRAYFAVNSNSWGSSAGGYNAAAMDQRMNLAPDRLIVFAAGNGGPGQNSVSGEALLKDGLSVGASDNFRPEQFESDNPNLIAGFSSRGGPGQSAGRIKPDVVAIGTSVVSLFARGETLNPMYVPGQAGLIAFVDKYCSVPRSYCATGDSPVSIPDYRYLQGTSMAAPHASGMALLTREYLREVAAGNIPSSPYFNPPSYLVKAIMINGAVRMDPNLYEYPGYDQGWGRLDVQQSLFPPVPRSNQFTIGTMAASGTCNVGTGICMGLGNSLQSSLNLNVAKSDVPVKVTLVWLDTAGDALARNLDLRVVSPGGNEYHGDQYTNGWSDPTKGAYDAVNNVEQVEVQAPETGTWTVEVRAVSVPTTARFALVFSADIGPTSQYKVDVSSTYPTAMTLSPSGSAVLPFTVLNYGTGSDTVDLSANNPPDVPVTFQPNNAVPLGSGESQDMMAVFTALSGAQAGVHEFDLCGVSGLDPSPTPASDCLGVRVEVISSTLPFPLQVTNGTVDELDPSVLTFDDAAVGRHIFVAYRKTSAVSPNGLTGGVNVWVAHTTVDPITGLPDLPFAQTMVINTNEEPNDLRLMRLTAGNLKNRVVITWTGTDPAELDPDAKSWARIAYLDPPYTNPWTVVMIEKNEGTASACNIARVSFPLFRAAPAISLNGQLIYVWETLAFASGCATQTAVVSSAKVSIDGGANWGPTISVFPPPGNVNYYFFPNGVVDQNDVAWIFCYWRTPAGNNRKLTVRLFDNNGWSNFPVTDYTIFNVPDNAQWPAALSTSEGGNRVYVTFTRDNSQTDLKMYLFYTTGAYSSSVIPLDYRQPGFTTPCPGCQLSADFSPPKGSGLLPPGAGGLGTSVSSANYNRRPILNIVRTSDGIVWLPHMENANAYAVPNLNTYYSGDGFATNALTILTSDAFARGHQMSDTLTGGGQGRVYEVYHSSRGTVTQVNYDVYLIIYFSNWPSAPDALGPLPSNVAGTPNPVNKSRSFVLSANLNDVTTGNNTVSAAEYFIDVAGPPGTGGMMWPTDGSFNSPIEAANATVDVGALGWADNECHMLYVRGQDTIGNWGPIGSVRQCTERGNVDTVPPVAPVLVKAELFPTISDVALTWNRATDEGSPGGTTLYQVFRQTGTGGSMAFLADVPATGSTSYTYVDAGAGDGDTDAYLYKIKSVDNETNNAQSVATGAKFTRGVTQGWNLVSVPVIQADPSVIKTFQTVDYNRVRTYLANDPLSDHWKTYIPIKGLQDLRTVTIDEGFWINANTPDLFTVAGLMPQGTVIGLVRGWNLVGFPSWRSTPYTVGDLKANVAAVTAVQGFDTSGPYFLIGLLDATPLQQGSAYWVWATGSATWVVP